MGPFEDMVERSYSHAANQQRLTKRRADPQKQAQGRVATRDFKKRGNQRHGQRQRSARRSRVSEARIRVYRGAGEKGMQGFRLSSEGAYGPGVYFYDNKKDAQVYAGTDGGIIVAEVDPNDPDVDVYPADVTVVGTNFVSRKANVVVVRNPAKIQVIDKLQESGPTTRDNLSVRIPPKLWHVTIFADKILSQGFKTRNQLGGMAVLGGGSSDSISFTSSKQRAKDYANGLKVCAAATETGFDPWSFREWHALLSKYGYNPDPLMDVWRWKQVADEKEKGRWDKAKASFEILQGYSFETRRFPLFMGGSWPKEIVKARPSDVTILEIDTEGPELWDYKASEDEFRIFDPENIGRARKVML